MHSVVFPDPGFPIKSRNNWLPACCVEAATASGGRSFFQTDSRELSATLTSIANELRSQYLLGYTPARPVAAEPSWHSIEVVVNRPGVRVRARDGYYSK